MDARIIAVDARPIIGSVSSGSHSPILKLQRQPNGSYGALAPEGSQDVLVEMRPDGSWEPYTSGPPTQLGLWRDSAQQQKVKRHGLLGWLGFTQTRTHPPDQKIDATEVRALEFLGDDSVNRDRYRDINLPPATVMKPWKAKHYDVSMKFVEGGGIESRARIQGIATDASPNLPLDFASSSHQVQVHTHSGQSNRVEMSAGGLLIEHPLVPAQEFDLEVAFTGQPQPVSHPAVPANLGWLTTDSSTITFNGVDRSSSWLPGDDSPSNKATYEFKVEVPKGHFAVANGSLIAQKETLTGTEFHYRSQYPMASYLASVNTFDSKEYTQTEISPGFQVVHPRDLEAQVRADFAHHPQMMKFLCEKLGPYPFESYGAIVTDLDTDTYTSRFTDGKTTVEADLGYQVAFEAQTRPIFPTSAFKGYGDFEETLVHELAHQWFGNAVTKATEQDIWVNEAFPSYSGYLWREQIYGPEILQSEMEALHQQLSAHHYKDTMACPDRDKLFSLENYGRMTLSMHALRLTLGDEAFYRTLQAIVSQHRYTSISVDQMVESANQLNEGKLTHFFQQWLYSEALPPLPDQPLLA